MEKWYATGRHVVTQFNHSIHDGIPVADVYGDITQAQELAKLIAAAPDSLDNHIYNVKALQGYSRWIPSTPTESELINAIKYSVKRSKDAIKKATE